MMHRLIQFSLNRPVTIAMIFLGICLSGGAAFRSLEIALLPDISYPQLTIVTEYPHASPEEVERFVTAPLEETLRSLDQLQDIYSHSQEGLSVTELYFQWGVGIDFALLHIREKITALRDLLPEPLGRSYVLNYNPNSEPILKMTLSGKGSLRKLARFSEDVLKPLFEQLEGVAAVGITGMPEDALKVIVDPQKLIQTGVTLAEVKTALEQNNPRGVLSGTVRDGHTLYPLRIAGLLDTPETFKDIVVKWNAAGLPIRLKDAAAVQQTPLQPQTLTYYDAQQVLGLLFYKEAGANTLNAARQIRRQVLELRKRYPELQIRIFQDRGHFIYQSIYSLIQAIFWGAGLAFGVLFLFLKRFRAALIVGVSIPVSILAVFNLFYLQHISLNIMSLGGLALGIGLIVDNAIIVIEAIFRSLQEGQDDPVYLGTREVARALAGATLTTISIFVPLVYVQGFVTEIFKIQALTIVYVLTVSLIVGLTLIPMLAAFFFRQPSTCAHSADREVFLPTPLLFQKIYRQLNRVWSFSNILRKWQPHCFRRIKDWNAKYLFQPFDRFYQQFSQLYHRVLLGCLERPGWTLLAFLLLGLAAYQIFLQTRKEYFPPVASRYAAVELEFPPEIAFSELAEQVRSLLPAIEVLPEVDHLLATIESASAGRKHAGTFRNKATGQVFHYLEINLILKSPLLDFSPLFDRLLPLLPDHAAAIRFRPGETVLQGAIGHEKKNLVLYLSGDNLTLAAQMGDDIALQLKSLPSLSNIDVQSGGKHPVQQIKFRRSALKKYQVSPETLARFLAQQTHGIEVGEWQESDRKIPVRMYVGGEAEKTLSAILASYFPHKDKQIPLREFFDLHTTEKSRQILRANQKRVVVISADTPGYQLPALLPEVEKIARSRITLAGYDLEVSGESRRMARAFGQLRFAILFAVIIVYMILAAQFESLLHPLNIILTVPMGIIGAALGIFLFQQSWNIISLIGLVMLVGIGVNDAIVKLDYMNLLRRQQGCSLRQAVLKASQDKLRPILMTSLTTIFALLPMAVGMTSHGDLNRPLAFTLIGGLLFTTLLTLILTPLLYELFSVEKNHEDGTSL